jgi:hypothetical protein
LAPEKTSRLEVIPESDNELLMFSPFRAQKDPEADAEEKEENLAPCVRGKDFNVGKGILITGQVTPAV